MPGFYQSNPCNRPNFRRTRRTDAACSCQHLMSPVHPELSKELACCAIEDGIYLLYLPNAEPSQGYYRYTGTPICYARIYVGVPVALVMIVQSSLPFLSSIHCHSTKRTHVLAIPGALACSDRNCSSKDFTRNYTDHVQLFLSLFQPL